MKKTVVILLLVWGLALVGGAGCGSKFPEGMPKLFPTTLIVVQDGKPLEGANVTLVQEDGSNQWSSVAVTNAQGKAEMFTNGQYQGVPLGKFKVVVSKQVIEPLKGNPMDDPNKPNMETEYEKYQEWYMKNEPRIVAFQAQQSPVFDLVDPQYSKSDTTPLLIEIVGKGEHTVDVGQAKRTPYNVRQR